MEEWRARVLANRDPEKKLPAAAQFVRADRDEGHASDRLLADAPKESVE